MFTICLQFIHTLFTTDPYNVLKDNRKGYTIECTKEVLSMTHINLNGVNFEAVKVKEIKPVTNTRTLKDCYKNPSTAKEEVFDKWYNYTIDFFE